jgi:hypothetical protein
MVFWRILRLSHANDKQVFRTTCECCDRHATGYNDQWSGEPKMRLIYRFGLLSVYSFLVCIPWIFSVEISDIEKLQSLRTERSPSSSFAIERYAYHCGWASFRPGDSDDFGQNRKPGTGDESPILIE